MSLIQAPVSADVMPVKRDDLYVLKVHQDSETQMIHFELCEFFAENLQTEKGCIGIGRESGYTEKQLVKQRVIEKWQTIGLWVGGAALVAASAGIGVSVGVGAGISISGLAGEAAIITGPLGGVFGAAGSASLVYFSDSLNPMEQSKDVKVLEDEVIQDKEVLAFEGSTVFEFAQRLDHVLGKIKN